MKMFSRFFETFFRGIHLQPQYGQKNCLKNGAFGTLDFIIEIALKKFIINEKSIIESPMHYFYMNFN